MKMQYICMFQGNTRKQSKKKNDRKYICNTYDKNGHIFGVLRV